MSNTAELQPWKSEIFHIDMKLRGDALNNVIYALNKLLHQLNPDQLSVAPSTAVATEIKELKSVTAHLDKILEGEPEQSKEKKALLDALATLTDTVDEEIAPESRSTYLDTALEDAMCLLATHRVGRHWKK
jgi:peptidoglycan hydrolase CwlO-like protein